MTVEDKSGPGEQPGESLANALDATAKAMKALVATVRKAEKGQAPLGKAVATLEQAQAVVAKSATLEARFSDAIKRLTEGQEKGWLEMEARIRELCQRRRWRIDGSWPSFIIEYGIHVKVDEKARGLQIGSSKIAGANMEAIEGVLAERVAGLIPRDYAPERFIEDLFAAYQDAKRTTAQVPVQDVYRSLVVRAQHNDFWRNAQKDRFIEITVDQFKARLCRALEANVVKTKGGSELRLYPPLDAKEGLFMYSPVDRRPGFIGRVEFSAGA